MDEMTFMKAIDEERNVNDEKGCKESDEEEKVIEETSEKTAATETTTKSDATNDDGLWTSNVW